MIIKIDIDKTIEQNKNRLKELERCLRELPDTTLYCRKYKNHYTYSMRVKESDGRVHEKYLPVSETVYIKQCAESRYYRRVKRALEKELKALEAFNSSYDPEAKIKAWGSLPEGLKQLTEPLYQDKKRIFSAWEQAEFERNDYPVQSGARYVSKKKEIVRSRIELIIANLLYDLGIPYRYECRLQVLSGSVYPDFTIMHPDTMDIYYIEVFGMMDDPEYEKNAFAKIAKYEAAGLYSHLIMFFDHENAPISISAVEKTIKDIFCP